MRIQFWSVGKSHDDLYSKGIAEFTGRLQKYYSVDWVIISPPKKAGFMKEPELKKQEANLILAELRSDDFLVLLDERGKMLSSGQLAELIQQRANESTKRLIFLIGGAFGVDAAIQQKAKFTWSLSRLVFPHMLVRLILSEQIYRGCTINRNEKYHHI